MNLDDRSNAAPVRPALPSVSVVIPSCGAATHLEEELRALHAQSYAGPTEILIVDNGMTASARHAAERWAADAADVRIVEAFERRGITYAKNAGARAARGELLAFCDDDDIVASTWLEALVHAAADAELVGGRLETERLNTPEVRQWRGVVLSPGGLVASHRFLEYVPGGNSAIWREAYFAVGGCDEGFRAGDDVDLSWRVQLAGGRVAYAQDAVLHYRFRPGVRPLARQMVAYGIGCAQLYKKYRGLGARREPLRQAAWHCLWLVGALVPSMRTVERRGRWVRQAAFEYGAIRGGIRHRVLYW